MKLAIFLFSFIMFTLFCGIAANSYDNGQSGVPIEMILSLISASGVLIHAIRSVPISK